MNINCLLPKQLCQGTCFERRLLCLIRLQWFLKGLMTIAKNKWSQEIYRYMYFAVIPLYPPSKLIARNYSSDYSLLFEADLVICYFTVTVLLHMAFLLWIHVLNPETYMVELFLEMSPKAVMSTALFTISWSTDPRTVSRIQPHSFIASVTLMSHDVPI